MSGATAIIDYSSLGVIIDIDGKGSILISDTIGFESDGADVNSSLYGIQVISGAFKGSFLPDLVTNQLHLIIANDGTFSIYNGAEGIPIESPLEAKAANVHGDVGYLTAPFVTAAYDNLVTAGEFSITARVVFSSTSSDVLFACIKDDSHGILFSVEADGSLQLVVLNGEGQTAVTAVDSAASSTIFNSEWHDFTAVKSGSSNVSIYLDGRALVVTTSSAATSILLPTRIARNSVTIGKFNGNIGHVSFWQKVLSAEEVVHAVYHPPVGAEERLVGYWPLEHDFRDVSTNENNASPVGTTGVSLVQLISGVVFTNQEKAFAYCTLHHVVDEASSTSSTSSTAANVVEVITRKQTVTVGTGSSFLVANLSKAGDKQQFLTGVLLSIIDPLGHTYLSDLNTDELFVLTNGASLECLIVKSPVAGSWIVNVTCPVNVSFAFQLETIPKTTDVNISPAQVATAELSVVYGAAVTEKKNSLRNLRSLLVAVTTLAVSSTPSWASQQIFDAVAAIAATAPFAVILARNGRVNAGMLQLLLATFASVVTKNAASYIKYTDGLGVIEGARKLANYTNSLTGKAGTTTFNIWSFSFERGAMGHASMTLSDGTHISWWPSSLRDPKLPLTVRQMSQYLNVIYAAPAFPNQTYENDVEYEGEIPEGGTEVVGQEPD